MFTEPAYLTLILQIQIPIKDICTTKPATH